MLAGAIPLNNKKRKEQYGFEKKERKEKIRLIFHRLFSKYSTLGFLFLKRIMQVSLDIV
jgi:hypothetical protein